MLNYNVFWNKFFYFSLLLFTKINLRVPFIYVYNKPLKIPFLDLMVFKRN